MADLTEKLAELLVQLDKTDAREIAKHIPKKVDNKLLEICDRVSPFHGVLFEVVMIVFIVHYLMIVSCAERAMDLAEVTDQCTAAQVDSVKGSASAMRVVGFIGIIACVVMLIISRWIEKTGEAVYRYANIALGVLNIVLFSIVLGTADSGIKSTANKCVSAAGTGHHVKALEELKASAAQATTWGAIGLVASFGYSAFHGYELFIHMKKK